MDQYIVTHGTIVHGWNFVGPFPSEDEAEHYARRMHSSWSSVAPMEWPDPDMLMIPLASTCDHCQPVPESIERHELLPDGIDWSVDAEGVLFLHAGGVDDDGVEFAQTIAIEADEEDALLQLLLDRKAARE